MTAICYIDASHKENKMGGGLFGFLYDESKEFTKIKKNKLNLILTKTKINGEDDRVNPFKFFYHLFREDVDENTYDSNCAELRNLEISLGLLKTISDEHKVKKIYIYADHDLSHQCLYNEITNEKYIEISNRLKELIKVLPKVKFEIVKGHSKIIGNDIAHTLSSVLYTPLENQLGKLHYLNDDLKELVTQVHPWLEERNWSSCYYDINDKSIYKVSTKNSVVKDTINDVFIQKIINLIRENNPTCSNNWIIRHTIINSPIMKLYFHIYGENIIIVKPFGDYGFNNIYMDGSLIAYPIRDKIVRETINSMKNIEYCLTNLTKGVIIKPVTDIFWEKHYKLDKVSRVHILPKNCKYINIEFDDIGSINYQLNNYNNEFNYIISKNYFNNSEIFAWVMHKNNKVYRKGFLITDGHGNTRIFYDKYTYLTKI